MRAFGLLKKMRAINLKQTKTWSEKVNNLKPFLFLQIYVFLKLMQKNFLRCFVLNYAKRLHKIINWFLCLPKHHKLITIDNLKCHVV